MLPVERSRASDDLTDAVSQCGSAARASLERKPVSGAYIIRRHLTFLTLGSPASSQVSSQLVFVVAERCWMLNSLAWHRWNLVEHQAFNAKVENHFICRYSLIIQHTLSLWPVSKVDPMVPEHGPLIRNPYKPINYDTVRTIYEQSSILQGSILGAHRNPLCLCCIWCRQTWELAVGFVA